MNVLFVPSYSHAGEPGSPASSDAIGYGVTSAAALVAAMRSQGCLIDVLSVPAVVGRTDWNAGCLARVERAVRAHSYDIVLAFHAFWPFAADLRRILDDSRATPILVAYTHGSHWDPSDLFRHERYPGLRWADLGNLLALDRILVVSDWMRATLFDNVRLVSELAAQELDARMRVVGLPVDLPRIEAAHRPPGAGVTVVFNHAPISAKRPGVFLELAADLLRATPASILVTRRFDQDSAWAARATELAGRFPARFVLGEDLAIDDYFAALWMSSVQVSTATHESLGVATLEAMATRNHCILPGRGAYPEVVGDDAEVLYNDDAQLFDLVAAVIGDPERQARVAARLQRRVHALYSPETIAAKVMAVLVQALGEGPRAAALPTAPSAMTDR